MTSFVRRGQHRERARAHARRRFQPAAGCRTPPAAPPSARRRAQHDSDMAKLFVRAASFGRRKSKPKADAAADDGQVANGTGPTEPPVEPPELKIATHSLTLQLQRSSKEARLGLGVLDNCMVTEVDTAGCGAAAGFSPGDWVVSIGGVAVACYDEMIPLLRIISTAEPTPIVVRYSPIHHPDRVAPAPLGKADEPAVGAEPEEAVNGGGIDGDGAQPESDGAGAAEDAAAATPDKSASPPTVTTAGLDGDARGTTEAVEQNNSLSPSDRDASPGTLMRLQAQKMRTVEDSILGAQSPAVKAATAADADAQGGKKLTVTRRASSFGRKRGDSRKEGSSAPVAVATKLSRSLSFGRKASAAPPTLAGPESAASVQPTGEVEYEGYLFKQSKSKTAFQKRFCFLQGGMLCYKDPKVSDHAIVCGQVTAADITNWTRYEIAIFADGHQYDMRSLTKAELEGWLNSCQAAAKRWLATQQ